MSSISGRLAELGLGPDEEILGLLGDPAGRHVQVLAPDGLGDLGDGDALGVHPVQVDLDLDLPLQAADEVDGPDAVHLLDLDLDLVVDELADLGQAHPAALAQDGEGDDRRQPRDRTC